MRRSTGTIFSWALLLSAPGCGGESKATFNDPTGSGAQGGAGGTGGSSASGGSSSTPGGRSGEGSGATGAAAGSSAGGSSGGSSSGGVGSGGVSGGAGSGAVSGSAGGTATGGGSGSASGGQGGADASAGMGSAGVAGTPVGPGIDGRWAMFGFEDPVVVDLRREGSALTGTGCCAGFDPSAPSCCGAITGQCDDRNAVFSFRLENLPEMAIYHTTVYISDDAQRLGGALSTAGMSGLARVAWVPLEGQAGRLGSAPEDLLDVLSARAGHFELLLESEAVGRFQPLVPHVVTLGSLGFIRSNFGPFYWGEMRWDATAQTLTAGPVPATDPSFATKLELRFDGMTLEQVVATYPDEPAYFFHVMPPVLP